MIKTVLITGATDGIGLETAKAIHEQGHRVLLHGRNNTKLEKVRKELSAKPTSEEIEIYCADLSNLSDVNALAEKIAADHASLDVVINNAGVFTSGSGMSPDGFELRFAVNAIAPYLLTKRLLPLLSQQGRVVNLSSAAQAPVDIEAISGKKTVTDNAAYAQSKLLLTMWSRHMGLSLANSGPLVVSVNPKSFLGSKMVKEAYGVAGGDIREGADILVRAAFSEEFANAHGQYFDNDIGAFTEPHSDALDDRKVEKLMSLLDHSIASFVEQ